MVKRIVEILVVSCVFFVLLCILLSFVHSSATPLIGIVFVSYISWRYGAVAGIALSFLNFGWIALAFRILAPEFTKTLPPDAFISFGVHIGVSLLLGYFGRLASDLRREKAALKQLRDELEERVESRTRELEKANEKLRQAEKMEAIGRIAGSISHDFNNYLNLILGYSSLLTSRLEPSTQEHEYACLIEKASGSAAELTSQLLTFARKKKYTMQSVAINEVIREVIPLISTAVTRNISIAHHAEPELPMIFGGADQIKSALLNLSLNARDAMKNGGTLTIATRTVQVTPEFIRTHGITCREGMYAGVSVTDTGCGIEPEIFDHLFEPFFTTKEEGSGTGMGLAAVYGIIQSHEGAVFAETKPGRGTTFTMLFPAVSAPSVS